jgi:hypothetical protein
MTLPYAEYVYFYFLSININLYFGLPKEYHYILFTYLIDAFKLHSLPSTIVIINKLELLTNTTVVDDAMRFVSEKGKEKIIKGNNIGDGGSKQEQDYNNIKKHTEKQGEEKQEEVTGELSSTTNQVF